MEGWMIDFPSIAIWSAMSDFESEALSDATGDAYLWLLLGFDRICRQCPFGSVIDVQEHAAADLIERQGH